MADLDTSAAAVLPLREVVAIAERDHIVRALEATNGAKERAAKLLGIARKTLWEKCKVYSIRVVDGPPPAVQVEG